MSRLERLEQQTAELNAEELKALRTWLDRFDAEVWDRQIQSDSKNGTPSRLVERALRDQEAGRSTKL